MPDPWATAARRPVLAWLGPPPESALSDAIRGIGEFRLGPDRAADLWLVWSSPTIRALQILSRAPVDTIVIHPTAPDRKLRQRFIDAGAREVVSVGALPLTLSRLAAPPPVTDSNEWEQPRAGELRGGMGTDSWLVSEESVTTQHRPTPPREVAPPAQSAGPLSSFQPGSLFGGGSALGSLGLGDSGPSGSGPSGSGLTGGARAQESETTAQLGDAEALRRALEPSTERLSRSLEPATEMLSRSLEPASAAVDPVSADVWPPPGLEEWIVGLERYIQARARWMQRARGRLKHYLELCHLREQMPLGTVERPRIDVFGQAKGKGQDTPPLRWPLLIRRTVGPGGTEVQVEEGRLMMVGTDGLVLDVTFQAGPKQKLLLDLNLSTEENAQIMVETAWQRRIGLRRWHVGAFILQMRRVRLDG